MPDLKGLYVCALLTLFAVNLESQRKEEPPSLDIDGTQIHLGMTQEQVMMALDKNGMKLRFLWDGHAALVVRKDTPDNLNDFDSQITFYGGRVTYVEFQFPEAHSAVQLAQEIAGAVDAVDDKNCALANFSAHGTGGGHSDVVANCGSKTITIMTTEPLNGQRSTHVEISIGSSVPPKGAEK